MRVAVTGATGHLGANLVRALLARGDRVRALVHARPTRRRAAPLAGLDVESVAAEVENPASLLQAFAGVDRVYHLAARISIAPGDDEQLHAVNVVGTRNVVEAALTARVGRLVHFSSIHALSAQPRSSAVNEDRPLAECSHLAYDRSKAASEKEVLAGVSRGLNAVIVNPTAVLGPHDYGPSAMGQVLLDLYRRAMPGLVAGGFDWVDARDVAAGALAAAERGRTGHRYLLSGAHKSLRELAALVEAVTGAPAPWFVSPMWLAQATAPFATWLAQLLGEKPRLTSASLHALCNHQLVSHEKATRELGYRPRPLEETIKTTFDWFRESQAI